MTGTIATHRMRRNHGQDQGRRQGRRTRRRRNDPRDLEGYQGPSDPAVSRHRPGILRSGHREPRRHRRPGDHRRGAGHQARTCRRQMRHDHPRRGTRRGIRPQAHVEVAQRHDPQHPGRHDLPRADRHLEHPPSGSRVDQADRGGTPCVRRPVQGHRFQGSRAGAAHRHLHARGRLRTHRACGVRLPRFRCGPGAVQPGRFHPRLRPRLLQLRSDARIPGVSVDEEHDPQSLRRPVQGSVRRGVRHRIPAAVRTGRSDLRAPPDRRYGGQLAEMAWRVRVGMQELRWRRAVGHRGPGIRIAGTDDLGADDPGRPDGRGRGRPRHRDAPLPPLAAGREDLHQSDRLDLRLDRRPQAPRQTRRHARSGAFRRHAGAHHHPHRGIRPHDQGSGHAHRPRPAVAGHRRVHGCAG